MLIDLTRENRNNRSLNNQRKFYSLDLKSQKKIVPVTHNGHHRANRVNTSLPPQAKMGSSSSYANFKNKQPR